MYGVTVLQNMAKSSKIFVILHHWILGSTNRHTVAMAEKVCKLKRISVYNVKEPVSFTK